MKRKRNSDKIEVAKVTEKSSQIGGAKNKNCESIVDEEKEVNVTKDTIVTDNAGEKFAGKLLRVEAEQANLLMNFNYPHPVAYTYNPIDYAWETHSKFVRKYCTSTKPLLFMGMNPGPFGMAQTGVPFGEISAVKNWMKISGTVGKPPVEHPKRPIQGFDCTRNEVSGQRFWGFFQDICKTPETFFKNAFVHNYCPLLFMRETSKNITPNELPIGTRKELQNVCDEALVKVVQLLEVKVIVGLGRFAQERARAALTSKGISDIPVGFLLHPSPISPAANKGWKEVACKQLTDLDLMQYFS